MGKVDLGLMIVCALALASSTSRSDVGVDQPPAASNINAWTPSAAAPEPTLGAPVTSNPGDEVVAHDPFTPYDVGPPSAVWSYDKLNASEKAIVDKGRADAAAQGAVQNAFAAAVRERAMQARGTSAAAQLGLENVDALGVVP